MRVIFWLMKAFVNQEYYILMFTCQKSLLSLTNINFIVVNLFVLIMPVCLFSIYKYWSKFFYLQAHNIKLWKQYIASIKQCDPTINNGNYCIHRFCQLPLPRVKLPSLFLHDLRPVNCLEKLQQNLSPTCKYYIYLISRILCFGIYAIRKYEPFLSLSLYFQLLQMFWVHSTEQ